MSKEIKRQVSVSLTYIGSEDYYFDERKSTILVADSVKTDHNGITITNVKTSLSKSIYFRKKNDILLSNITFNDDNNIVLIPKKISDEIEMYIM